MIEERVFKKDAKQTTLKAIEKFWKVIIEYHDKDFHTFQARSLAYIGHILTRRKELILREEELDWKPTCFSDTVFKKYLNDPISTFEAAYKLKKDDVIVLNRYGRAMLNKTYRMNGKDSLEYLQKAEQLYSASINIDKSSSNLWAFSSRMQVRHQIANAIGTEQSQNEILENAKKDGIECFKSRHTRQDMTLLAKICGKLSKWPDPQKCGPKFVKNKKLLYEALDYLFHSNCLGDPVDFNWTCQIASCLFDLGEYEQAIKWQRKALLLSWPSITYSFSMTCYYMLTMFEERNIWKTSDTKLFRELLSIMSYGRQKYDDITSTISKLYLNKRREFFNFLHEILCERKLTLLSEEKAVIVLFLETFVTNSRGYEDNAKFQNLKGIVDGIIPVKQSDFALAEKFKMSSYQPPVMVTKPQSVQFKYDFFVSYSHKDRNWVENFLCPYLETKFDESDMDFKGCIADRDFTPGTSVLNNIIDAIQESGKVLLILTERFVSSNWCNYEADQAVIKSLMSKELSKCVIPVLLEKCEIPCTIRHLNYTDLTKTSNNQEYFNEMRRLKKALLPSEK